MSPDEPSDDPRPRGDSASRGELSDGSGPLPLRRIRGESIAIIEDSRGELSLDRGDPVADERAEYLFDNLSEQISEYSCASCSAETNFIGCCMDAM
jgi:hypothetical protein